MAVGQREQDLDRGRRIGKYEIVTRLSVGGMAELFLAFTSGPGGFRKYVALKQILPDVAKDQDFVKMFLDEARITAAFSHANVGSVFDLGQEAQELYLAMEFISGQNLQQILKAALKAKQPLPIGFSARVARDACLGLHYAHTFVDRFGTPSPVIHRDVSPKNVMVSYAGEVKVIDFGIAKAKNRLGKTQVGMVKGTRGYMSPEQVKGASLDGRSDLFCMGAMLYEMLVGEKLFATPSDTAVMVEIVEGGPPQLPKALPDALADVVLRALERDRDLRFTTGKEMARAIEAALGAEVFDDDSMAEVMSGLFARERDEARLLLEGADVAAEPVVNERTAPVPVRKSGVRAAVRGADGRVHVSTDVEDDVTRAPRRPAGTTPRPRSASPEVVETEVRRSPPKRSEAVETEVRRSLQRRREAAEQEPQRRHDTLERPAARRKSRGWIVALVLVLLVIGGAFTPWAAPVRAWVSPHLEQAKSALHDEMREPAPPDTSVQALPPEIVAQMKARQEALEAEAKAKAEEKARIDRELAALDAREAAEREQAKAQEEAAARPTGARPPPRTTKPPDDKTTTRDKNGEVADVLDTKTQGAAARSGLGWLSLFTVPPAAIYDGETLLGTTPLHRVPLAFGTYRLTVIDPEGARHVLSAPIEKGKETKLVIRVADIPLE